MECTAQQVEVAGRRLDVATFTDIGPVRSENQDAWAVVVFADREHLGVVLADGMGGHPGGGAAARLAVDIAAGELRGGADPQAALRIANEAVGTLRGEIGGSPGTTLTIALVDAGGAEVAHVGDSRGYLVEGDGATPITEDHSWVADEIRAGRLETGSERSNPRRNILTRALLGDPVQPFATHVDLEAGTALLLCSDGLWEPLADSEIGALLTSAVLEDAVSRLGGAALAAGATDNVTAVVVRPAS